MLGSGLVIRRGALRVPEIQNILIIINILVSNSN